MTTADTIVCDLDGTLADCAWRANLVEGDHRDYEKFHELLIQDPPNPWCADLLAAMYAAGYRIVLVSARPKSALMATLIWLQEKRIRYHELFLVRETGDSTPDQELKRAWLRGYGRGRIKFVVDDRFKVVKMWREEGLICLHCAAPKEN